MTQEQFISIMKASAWENAKGRLREVASLSGQHIGGRAETTERWELIEQRIEEFIRNFEDDALHE